MNQAIKSDNLWVAQVGEVIIARIRGDLNKDLFLDLSHNLSEMARNSGKNLVLLDALEMHPPNVELPILQWKINDEQKDLKLRRAIVVPDAKMAYLARLAFGDADHRVFYNDLVAAVDWLLK